MGEYIYHLTTKSRRIRTADGPQDMFLCALAGKEQRVGYGASKSDTWAANLIAARRERLWQAWHKRGQGPKYVVMSQFADGAYVYTNWPRGCRNTGTAKGMNFGPDHVHRNPQIEILEAPYDAKFAGILRAEGSRLRFEPWFEFEHNYDRHEDATACREAVAEFMQGREYLSRMEFNHMTNQAKVVFSCKNDTDATLIKMAML